MIRPDLTIVPLGSDQHAGVVEDAHVERPGLDPRVSAATRRRAALSSASVKAPCSFSHSVTARSPSRTTSARLAARVIQAETLTPSSAEAERIPSWTSGSTVIASLGEGRPRDIAKVYYQSRRILIRSFSRAGPGRVTEPAREERHSRSSSPGRDRVLPQAFGQGEQQERGVARMAQPSQGTDEWPTILWIAWRGRDRARGASLPIAPRTGLRAPPDKCPRDGTQRRSLPHVSSAVASNCTASRPTRHNDGC